MKSFRRVLAVSAIAVSGFIATSQAFAADIVDTAVAAGNFKTLVAAVTAAGLVDTLKGPGPFTVFAPTDEAFAKLPAGLSLPLSFSYRLVSPPTEINQHNESQFQTHRPNLHKILRYSTDNSQAHQQDSIFL